MNREVNVIDVFEEFSSLLPELVAVQVTHFDFFFFYECLWSSNQNQNQT